jgi:hypothetical protein
MVGVWVEGRLGEMVALGDGVTEGCGVGVDGSQADSKHAIIRKRLMTKIAVA